MHKTFYIECSLPLWVDVAQRARDRYGIEPVYWTGAPNMAAAVDTVFPNCSFQDNYDAVRCQVLSEYRDLVPPPLDQALLERMAIHERTVLKMMDRMDWGNAFPYGARVEHYHAYLRYWLSVLEAARPDLVVMPVSPHLMYDYVLYALCHDRGIEVLLFRETNMPALLVPMASFREGSSGLREAYRAQQATGDDGSVISDGAEAHLAALRGDYAAAEPSYMKKQKQIRKDLERRRNLFRLVYVWRYPMYIRAVKKRIVRPAGRNYMLEAGQSPEAAGLSKRRYTRYRRQAAAYKAMLETSYQAHVSPNVDLETPFVFFALHYQPERTTCPDAGSYAYQYLIAELIVRNLPDGWSLLVKEHPSQFMPHMSGELGRDVGMYERLAALPNTHLVGCNVSSFELADRAQAVATSTGTAGWEAVVRGTPVLCFGYPWYMDCDGVHRIDSSDDCRRALESIAAGSLPDPAKVRAYVAAVEEVGVRGFVDPVRADESGMSDAENAASLAEAIGRAVADKPEWGMPQREVEVDPKQ